MTLQQNLMQAVSNRRKEDKFGIAYMVGMMDWDGSFAMRHWPESYKRQEILDRFEQLINTDKVYHLKDVPRFKPFFEQAAAANS